MIRKRPTLIFLLSFLAFTVFAQAPKKPTSADIQQMLKKLNVLGTVLYVAAHPDDENTQLITWLANEKLYRTGYLSATRGDGGQNLIGPEIREELGVIRTQELLAARRIDGGVQFFSRANDFGYSKTPDETFSKWNREQVLADFVRVIRSFRPDVIITRFNTEPGTTHGHHTASAILAKEAFIISGDERTFPEQFEQVAPWSPKKLYWNTSWWFYQRSGEQFDTTGLQSVNVGLFNTLLGRSYTEIAAESRSMHKSQGFGRSGTRGAQFEYLERWEGESGTDIFDGINTTWSRVENSEEVAYHIAQAIHNFDPEAPYAVLEDLLLARKELMKLPGQFWKEVKLREIDEVIRAVTGTFLEVTANDYQFIPGDTIKLTIEAINRSPVDMKLSSVRFSAWEENYIYQLPLTNNQKNTLDFELKLPEDVPYSHPYWLEAPPANGMYQVEDPALIGMPENPPLISARFTLNIEGQFVEYQLPVVYKESDPVEGEVYRPLVMAPKVMVTLDERPLIFASGEPKEVPVTVRAGTDDVAGELMLKLPAGWRSFPEYTKFELGRKGEQRVYTFLLYPSKHSVVSAIEAVAQVDGKTYNRGIREIDYAHIPIQTLFPYSRTKVVKLDLVKSGDKIGYIMGAGDDVPFSLEQIGYQVDLLRQEDVNKAQLAGYDAVILGVRAFNTVPWLAYKNRVLFDYVSEGGNLIVQYNTSHRLVTEDIAPYKLTLSRDRVTVEEAEMKVIASGHRLVNRPNRLSKEDFEGWVQERGLYFPNSWSEDFTPVFSMHDPGEEPLEGSLLVAEYGKGHYIYTGLSFFRELPAGVPGAYRLLANIISLGKEDKP